MVKKVTEKWVKQQVVKKLKDLGAYHFFPVANGYMSSGVPDIIACYQSQFIGIECKANGNNNYLFITTISPQQLFVHNNYLFTTIICSQQLIRHNN